MKIYFFFSEVVEKQMAVAITIYINKTVTSYVLL